MPKGVKSLLESENMQETTQFVFYGKVKLVLRAFYPEKIDYLPQYDALEVGREKSKLWNFLSSRGKSIDASVQQALQAFMSSLLQNRFVLYCLMKSSKNKKGPTNREIAAHWATHESECGLSVDWAEAHERCWGCGYECKLEQCHIIPNSRGGSNQPENLVLLCKRCHRQAPNISDPRYMWIWLRANASGMYDSAHLARATFEFYVMFGRKPFEGMVPEGLEKAMDRVMEIFRSTVVHYGESYRNPVTEACIFARVEELVTGVHPEPQEGSWLDRNFGIFSGNKRQEVFNQADSRCDRDVL